MTAPLLSSIVAVLFACLGYAAGRAHQWRRGGWDRAQAYQDGYDEATRSTLSMAARIAAPVAQPQPPNPAPGGFPVPSAAAAAVPFAAQSATGAAPSSLAPSAAGVAGSFSSPAGPLPAATAEGAVRTSPPGGPEDAFPAAGNPTGGPSVADRSAQPELSPRHANVADGGRTSEPALDARASGAFFEPVMEADAGAADEFPVPRLGRRGRHYVPDELVRAATYRLSPDRVARAKVQGALPLPAADDGDDLDPELRNPVPKPRSS
jgi:hypothetical protein